MEVARDVVQGTEVDTMLGVVLVDVRADDVNDTPNPVAGYVVTELDGSPPRSLGDEPLRCETCGRLFDGEKPYSRLGAHQGKPCVPEPPEFPHPVRVSFASERKPLVKSFLALHHLELEEISCGEAGTAEACCAFVVDVSLLQRRLRELAFAEASCCNLEHWYQALREHTAETKVLPLSDDELTMFQKLHAAWHVGYGSSVDPRTMSVQENLERRLQQLWEGSQDPFFVKTSMRSPKDAVKVQSEGAPHERLRQELASSAVRSAGEATELLAASRRVVTDIAQFRKYGSCQGALNLIMRRWDPFVASSVEWRCFVSEGSLTAISQYHCYTVLPEVIAAAAVPGAPGLVEVRNRVAAFQKQVHPVIVDCLGLTSYVLDLATNVGGDMDTLVRLVEINPFHTSGAGVFSWRHDGDLLLRGRADGIVELRVVRRRLD